MLLCKQNALIRSAQERTLGKVSQRSDALLDVVSGEMSDALALGL